MFAMTDNPLARLDGATAVAERVIAAVKPDQLGDGTPCESWTVRQLINHVVTGNLVFTSILRDGEPVDRAADGLGEDPLAAYRASVADLRAAFGADGALDRMYPTPFGEGPGTILVTMRMVEHAVHSWDIARATGQSTDLDPEVAAASLAALRHALPAERDGDGPFGTEQTAPPSATAADRMAAFAGRTVA
jgi:uncharacterized protein (TIGR03086 family)